MNSLLLLLILIDTFQFHVQMSRTNRRRSSSAIWQLKRSQSADSCVINRYIELSCNISTQSIIIISSNQWLSTNDVVASSVHHCKGNLSETSSICKNFMTQNSWAQSITVCMIVLTWAAYSFINDKSGFWMTIYFFLEISFQQWRTRQSQPSHGTNQVVKLILSLTEGYLASKLVKADWISKISKTTESNDKLKFGMQAIDLF